MAARGKVGVCGNETGKHENGQFVETTLCEREELARDVFLRTTNASGHHPKKIDGDPHRATSR